MTQDETSTTTTLGQARTPDDTRFYAIGDVHGCLEELKSLHDIIRDDLTLRPIKRHRIIHLGDYVDRGPDSMGCIQFLIDMVADDPAVICLKGNHEDKLLKFLAEPVQTAKSFLTYGGQELSLSYGVTPVDIYADEQSLLPFRDTLCSAIPNEHISFLTNLPKSFVEGDYMFVHAGVRPDIDLNKQEDRDLMWIRSTFLEHPAPLGKVIVHGHTPHREPEVRNNRINVDTLAYDTGKLTCVALEADQHIFFSTAP